MPLLRIVIAVVFAVVVAAPVRVRAAQPDMAAVGGDLARSFFGTGRGVTIGILDGGIDANHPAVRGSVVAARDFSRSGTSDDDNRSAGHATGIAGIYIGHGSGYTGLAPGAGIINARVITDRDYTDDSMAGAGLFYALENGASVLNLSFGNKLGQGPLTKNFNLMVDYAAETYGATILSAAGNEDDTAVNQTPAGAYNGLTIGALQPGSYNKVSSFSNFAMKNDRRSKPDLVAPGQSVTLAAANWERASTFTTGSGTSFATAYVGGVVAQMVGYGQSHNLSTDPRLMKAILLTSATKVNDSDGDNWQARSNFIGRGGRKSTDLPLDDEQGAGRVDAMDAYSLYARAKSSATPYVNWALGSLKRFKTYKMDMGRLSAGQEVNASAVWNYHIGRTDNGNRLIDEHDTYYESLPLANFILTLLKDGQIVANSDARFDNTEHLAFRVAETGNYTLTVYRREEGGGKNESFAVAARVLQNSTLPQSMVASAEYAVPFAADGVMRSVDLSGVSSVPEPSGLLVLAAGLALGGCGRRARVR